MSQKSLEDVINAAGNPVNCCAIRRPGRTSIPVVPPEYTNWRDEQRAWQKTCVLFNQSYHMTDMYVEGPDALKLLSALGVNSFKNFRSSKAKQFVACNHDGYVIGDVILFHLEPNRFNLVGRPPVHNWVQFHCETGGYNVKVERDERSVARPGPDRAQDVPLPGAGSERDEGDGEGHGQAPCPTSSSSTWTRFTIAGRRRPRAASRHGRASRASSCSGRGTDGDAVARRDRRGGQGVRAAAGRRANVFDQHTRVGLDSVAAAGRLHRRRR